MGHRRPGGRIAGREREPRRGEGREWSREQEGGSARGLEDVGVHGWPQAFQGQGYGTGPGRDDAGWRSGTHRGGGYGELNWENGPDGPGYGGGRSTHRGGYGERNWENGPQGPGPEPPRGSFAGKGPKGWTRSDDRIREDVCERLHDHPDVDATDVEVAVEGGVVTLRGVVAERQMKRQAEDAADAVSGVKEVQNLLRLAPREGGPAAAPVSGRDTATRR